MEKRLKLEWLDANDTNVWQFCLPQYKEHKLRMSILVDKRGKYAFPVLIEIIKEDCILPIQIAVFYSCWDAVAYCKNLSEEELDAWIEEEALLPSDVADWISEFQ